MYSVCHNYIFILLFQMLATSFGLNRASSGRIFIKTDDGLFRPKLQGVQLKSGTYFNISNLFTNINNTLYYTTNLYLQ